jgi:hypothetical protein
VSADPRAVLREALTLTEGERADLAAELLASLEDAGLEDPAVVSELWPRELERRARGVLTGADDGEPWSDLRTRLTDQLTSG